MPCNDLADPEGRKGREMKTARHIVTMVMISAALQAASVMPAAALEVKASYLYKLSNFTGAIPFSTPGICADKVKNEIYVLSGDAVSIFNSAGMEIYRADYDPEVGTIYDLAVDGEGNVITLAFNGKRMAIMRCNYRLEPQRTIAIRNLPPEFAGLSPNKLRYHDGRLYLASTSAMMVVVTDLDGEFVKGYDLVAMLGEDLDDKEKSRGTESGKSSEQRRSDNGLGSFSVDPEGNILFVLPVLGKAGRISTDGTATLFGTRGHGTGKFGVPGGITADRAGNYLVSDKLRNIIIVFDRDLRLVTEFSSFKVRDALLTSPTSMDVDGAGKLYVSQAGRRGVNVYQISVIN